MNRVYKIPFVLLILVQLFTQITVGFAAAATAPAQTTNAVPAIELQKIRVSQSPEKVRIVLDVSALPEYSVNLLEDKAPQNKDAPAAHISVTLPKTINKGVIPALPAQDPVFKSLRISEAKEGITAVIDLKTTAVYNVFTLKNPNRIVIDIVKKYEHKIKREIAPGLTYTALLRGTAEGPLTAHILDLDPKAGWKLQPLLSNQKTVGLEKLSSLMQQAKGAAAAVNAAYFGLDGTTLGVMQLQGTIIASMDITRTALGILPDGSAIIDDALYQGSVELPDGQKVAITGVNEERGADALILYNSYYDTATDTNPFGSEYVVVGNKITAINTNNSVIPQDGFVLSVHGKSQQALGKLQVGDTVKVTQNLGDQWSKAVAVIGAGPRLVKNNSVYLTTKLEEFGSDVAVGRAPRTAVGITKEGHILLMVVDGRQKHSIGLTLLDTALLMQELGSIQAMNLDGGGSSEMIVQKEIVNKPSDGHERSIGTALAVISTNLAN